MGGQYKILDHLTKIPTQIAELLREFNLSKKRSINRLTGFKFNVGRTLGIDNRKYHIIFTAVRQLLKSLFIL